MKTDPEFQDGMTTGAYAALDEKDIKINELEEALDWALTQGASYSYDFDTIYDDGCGCCSGPIPMTEIPTIIIEKLKEKKRESTTD